MSQKTSTLDIHDLQDISTPVGQRLSGVYKKSFAYTTIKDRLPIILTKVVDTLSRNKDALMDTYGQEAAEEIKYIVGFVSKLKNEMVTNKTLKPMQLVPNATDNDADLWNKYLEKRTEIEGETPLWFNTLWLYCECYMYRILAQELLALNIMNDYDPFGEQKKNGFIISLDSVSSLSAYVLNLLSSNLTETERRQELVKQLKLSLWGNRCDLSLSAGAESSQSGDPVALLQLLDNDLLVDHTELVWNLLRKQEAGSVIIDLVCDNAGYELFTDLCLASFLIAHGFAQKIRFHVKRYPWYVSDTRMTDFQWTIDTMNKTSNENLQQLSKMFSEHLKSATWTVEDESYWTGPYDFTEMRTRDPVLYAKLSDAKLVIFKGDLNYRKLLGDLNWPYTTSFREALGNFAPTKILSLRTLKSDVCVGLPEGKAEELSEKDENWLLTGQYGVIQTTLDECCQCSNVK